MEEDALELDGYGDGSGSGDGDGDGDGYGYGSGYGYGYGSGYGYGDGDGYGYGDGYGDGSGSELQMYFKAVAEKLKGINVLTEPNAELKRMMIELIGADNFFKDISAEIVHQDFDGYMNPRQLLRIPLEDTEAGYIQAVKVVCPTTKRIYHLGVPPDIKTCQDAVASTFGMKPEEYKPERES